MVVNIKNASHVFLGSPQDTEVGTMFGIQKPVGSPNYDEQKYCPRLEQIDFPADICSEFPRSIRSESKYIT